MGKTKKPADGPADGDKDFMMICSAHRAVTKLSLIESSQNTQFCCLIGPTDSSCNFTKSKRYYNNTQ